MDGSCWGERVTTCAWHKVSKRPSSLTVLKESSELSLGNSNNHLTHTQQLQHLLVRMGLMADMVVCDNGVKDNVVVCENGVNV